MALKNDDTNQTAGHFTLAMAAHDPPRQTAGVWRPPANRPQAATERLPVATTRPVIDFPPLKQPLTVSILDDRARTNAA
jgi:hypothetical protein